MEKSSQIVQSVNCTIDGAHEHEIKQVFSNLSHAQCIKVGSTREKFLSNSECVHSDRIEPQLRQRACLCAQNLLCFQCSTSDSSVCELHHNRQSNGCSINESKCDSSASNLCGVSISDKSSNDNLKSVSCDLNCRSKDYLINRLDKSGNRTQFNKVKSVRSIGVFYSDLCDVVKSMRSYSSQSNNSSFKSDKPDKENLLDNSNDIAKVTMVKTPLNRQKNGITNQRTSIDIQQSAKPNTSSSKLNVNQFVSQHQSYFTEKNKMNEQLIAKDKKFLPNKSSTPDQNLCKHLQHSQLLLQVPAECPNFNDNGTDNAINATSCTVSGSADEVDAFRLLGNSQQYQLNHVSNSVSNVTVNNCRLNSVNSINDSLTQQSNILNTRSTNIPNLPDLLHSHVPPPAYSTLPDQQCPNGNVGGLTSRQLARLQQPIAINTLPNNLTAPLSLNIARSRNSTAALLGTASLSPNTVLNARVHQPLSSAENYRNILSNPLNNQLSSVPISQPNNNLSATMLNGNQPTVVPPHVHHHHQFRFPLNAHRFTASTGHFLGTELDAMTTQSKSCLSCTSMGLRWGILLIAFIGLLCSIVGTCLFAIRPSGRDNFTLAIILLGVGIVLIAVSSIVWKINSEPLDDTALPHLNSVHVSCTAFHPNATASTRTPNDPESLYSIQQQPGQFKFRLIQFYHQITNLFCCAHRPTSSPVFGSCSVNALSGPAGANSSTGNLLEPTSLTNINSTNQHNTIYGHHRRFLPRLPNNGSGRSNAHHPYGAMFYPEFESMCRPPPPSYAASMQEYRLRMLFYERTNGLPNSGLDISSNTPATNANNCTNNSVTTTNSSATNSTNVQTSTTNTFSGNWLSNLGSFVSNSFSGNNQQNSPPPTYRSTGSTLAGALCRSLAFYNSSRPISRPPSYRSVVAENANRNQNNVSNQADDGHLTQETLNKKISTSHLKKNCLQENSIKDNVHRVTIHQTTTSSQVCTNDGVNIVAYISSSLPHNSSSENNQTNSDNSRTYENEVQTFLAHL